MEVVKKHFRPEFLNRIDDQVIFNPLGKEQVSNIALMQLEELKRRLHEQDLEIEFDQKLIDYVSSVGYDPLYGARPIKRAVKNVITDPLAEILISGKFKPKSEIAAKLQDHKAVFE